MLIMEGCSSLFFCLGFLLWKRERIDIIHDYHIKKIKEKDKKAYTIVMGKAMTVIAIGLAVSGIIGLFTDSVKSGIPLTEPRCMMCQEMYDGALSGVHGYVVYEMYYNA